MKISKDLAIAIQRRWGKLMDRIRGIGGQVAVDQWWKENHVNAIIEAKRYRWILALICIPFLLSAQAPQQGFVQTYNGDNQSQVILAISSNRVFLQSLAPGDPITSYRILTHVQDGDIHFLRATDHEGYLHTVLANRFNVVITSEWGNTWYWQDTTSLSDPAPIESTPKGGYTPEEPCELLDFGPISNNGLWAHFYSGHVDLSYAGYESHQSLLVDMVATGDDGTRAFLGNNLVAYLPANTNTCNKDLITWGYTEDGHWLVHLYEEEDGYRVTWSLPGKSTKRTATADKYEIAKSGLIIAYKGRDEIAIIYPKK